MASSLSTSTLLLRSKGFNRLPSSSEGASNGLDEFTLTQLALPPRVAPKSLSRGLTGRFRFVLDYSFQNRIWFVRGQTQSI